MQPDEDKPKTSPRKLSPEDPAARDEGPRLIPLPERREQARLFEPEHYLELAAVAIRKKKD
jgi:hypothetical protein